MVTEGARPAPIHTARRTNGKHIFSRSPRGRCGSYGGTRAAGFPCRGCTWRKDGLVAVFSRKEERQAEAVADLALDAAEAAAELVREAGHGRAETLPDGKEPPDFSWTLRHEHEAEAEAEPGGDHPRPFGNAEPKEPDRVPQDSRSEGPRPADPLGEAFAEAMLGKGSGAAKPRPRAGGSAGAGTRPRPGRAGYGLTMPRKVLCRASLWTRTRKNPGEILLMPPSDGDSREYRAFRGKTTAAQDMILLIPGKGGHDTYLPVSDIRIMDADKTGREIIIECSTATIRIAGRNLRAGAHAIANRLCGSIEAHDQQRRDTPADPLAPFVESIRFYDPPGRKAESDQDQPQRSGKPIVPK